MRREPRPFLFAILVIATFVTLALPRSVAACSCVPPDAILEGAIDDPGSAIFTAVIGPSMGSETSATVTRWFKGGIPLPIVIFEIAPGDGASCGTGAPPAGGEYLFAMPLEGNRGGLSLCSLMADVQTPDGQAWLTRVMELGPGAVPSTTDPPSSGAPSARPGAVDPTPVGLAVSVLGAVAPIGVALAFGLGLIGGVILILRRRERGPRG